jgi:hypothetical protein
MAGDSKRVAVLPGDDAAPEAVYPTLDLLRSMELPVEWLLLPDGDTLASTMSRAEAESLVRGAADSCDALLLGQPAARLPASAICVGAKTPSPTSVPSGIVPASTRPFAVRRESTT